MSKLRTILVAGGAAVIVAFLGGWASRPGPWYDALDKAALNPPDWVFGPAWTLIYASCVAAAVIAWHRISASADRAKLITLFFINAVFNIGWSFAFFTLQRPDWALAEVIVLWLSVAALILFLRKISGVAAALLVPYLLWVSFASYLNYAVVALNGPFG
jgi:tryptophan-rich sensory protein